MKVMKIGNQLKVKNKMTYNWNDSSTYIKHPPFFKNEKKLSDIKNARILALLVIV